MTRWFGVGLLTAVFLLSSSVLPMPTAHACSCIETTLEEAFERADAAFVGRLVEVRRPKLQLSSADESRFIFEVDTVYRGEVYERQSLVSVSDGASCGIELPLDLTAIVFGSAEGFDVTPVDGEYAGSLCDGSRVLGGDTVVPAAFGPGVAPLAGSSPSGPPWSDRLVRYLPVIAVVIVAGAVMTVVVRRRRRPAAPPPAVM